MNFALLGGIAAIVSSTALMTSAQQAPGGPAFTAAQAAAGRTAYEANCAACHGATLADTRPLSGPAFVTEWKGRAPAELTKIIQSSMPPANPGGLPAQDYANITAYILQFNGLLAGAPAQAAAPAAAPAPGADPDAPQAPAGRGRGAGAQAAAQPAGGRGAVPGPTGVTVTGEVKNFTPVTDEMLRNPAPGNWPLLRRDQFASNFSPLNQITADNVKGLQLAWVWPMNEGGTQQPSPLAHNGTIFLNNTGGIIQALDGKTGDLIWEHRLGVNAAMRGMSLYDDKLFIATSNARLVALNARTGAKVWETPISDGRSNSSGPLAAKGKIIQGLGGCQQYIDDKCFISAYDAATGKQVWKFNTVAVSGQQGGDSWGKNSNAFRAGGETWITGSYDPATNLTYWGTAQAKPWMPASRQMATLDKGLFTSSTVALDVDSGKLAWYYQHAPGEALDLDIVFERVLVDSGSQNLVFTAGKDGILWKLDRKTGKYLAHTETTFQNVWDRFDPATGEPRYRRDILEHQVGQWIDGCPSTEGGHNWQAMSHHKPSNQLIIPLSQSCLAIRAQTVEQRIGGGSPRLVPSTIAPEIRVPTTGQALYVFALAN